MFEVKKDVPLTPSSRSLKYPFHEMEVGDCFDVPRNMGRTLGKTTVQNSVTSSSRGYAKRHNPDAKFATRTIDENTIRCWRVK